MDDILCIWCGQHDPDPAPEHIFPAALGCPDDFCLTNGEVCTTCNNGLGHLDQTIIDDLDVMAFARGVPRRGGKPPLLANRRNVRGEAKHGKPIFYLNAERHSVDIGDGRMLPGFRGSGRDVPIGFTIDRESGKATVKLSWTIGGSPKFVRALHKIAFTSLAYYSGHEVCLDHRYNEVRNFVTAKRRRGHRPLKRRALMFGGSDEPFRFQSWPPVGPGGEQCEIMRFRLGAPEFLVDLSPRQVHLPEIVKQFEHQLGQNGWGLLPPARDH